MKTYVLLALLSLALFQATAVASTECPSDLGISSGCSPSVFFSFGDTVSSYSVTVNSLLGVPGTNDDYLVGVTNYASPTIYSITFYWDPTVGSSLTNYSCGGGTDGDAPTYGVCDPIETVFFAGGIAPGESQGFAVKFLPYDSDFCKDAGYCAAPGSLPDATILDAIANIDGLVASSDPVDLG